MSKIKIKQLSEVQSVRDKDLFILEDDNITHKITAENIVSYMQTHPKIYDYFVQNKHLGAANGAAPLNSNKKIEPQFITYGITAGTSFEGNEGKQLKEQQQLHEKNQENPHHTTKEQIGLTNVENKSSTQIRSEINSQNVAKALGYVPEIEGAYENAVAYTDHKISSLIGGASESLDTLKEIEDALKNSSDTVTGILGTLSNKAEKSELTSHTTNNTIHTTASERSQYGQAYNHATSAHAPANATKTASSSVNGNIRINDTETTIYTHPESGAAAGTYLFVKVDKAGHITQGYNDLLSVSQGGTGASNGTDAIKKFGIEASITELNKLRGLTPTTAELNCLKNISGNIQEQLNKKANSDTITSLPTITTQTSDKFLKSNGTTSSWEALTRENITDLLGYTPQNPATTSQTVSQTTEPTTLKTGDFWEVTYTT